MKTYTVKYEVFTPVDLQHTLNMLSRSGYEIFSVFPFGAGITIVCYSDVNPSVPANQVIGVDPIKPTTRVG